MRLGQEELKKSFRYELVLYPLSLFIEGGFCRSKNSATYSLFNTCERNITTIKCRYVIDCVFLLHRVVWPSNQTVRGNLIDLDIRSTMVQMKFCESFLMATMKAGTDIVFDARAPMSTTQDVFLANSANKMRCVSLLSNYLGERHIDVLVACDDADIHIVRKALEFNCSDNVVVVGEDIDLLVLVLALTPKKRKFSHLNQGKEQVLAPLI